MFSSLIEADEPDLPGLQGEDLGVPTDTVYSIILDRSRIFFSDNCKKRLYQRVMQKWIGFMAQFGSVSTRFGLKKGRALGADFLAVVGFPRWLRGCLMDLLAVPADSRKVPWLSERSRLGGYMNRIDTCGVGLGIQTHVLVARNEVDVGLLHVRGRV
jgi:hypothetical protein